MRLCYLVDHPVGCLDWESGPANTQLSFASTVTIQERKILLLCTIVIRKAKFSNEESLKISCCHSINMYSTYFSTWMLLFKHHLDNLEVLIAT